MKKIFVTAICLVVLAIGYAAVNFNKTEASPATSTKSNGCAVRDANGAQYFDANCQVHTVEKFDNDGNLQFLKYQDHGTLPATAARPKRATRFSTFYSCGGCAFEGTYDELVTPSGEYQSSGPN